MSPAQLLKLALLQARLEEADWWEMAVKHPTELASKCKLCKRTLQLNKEIMRLQKKAVR